MLPKAITVEKKSTPIVGWKGSILFLRRAVLPTWESPMITNFIKKSFIM